MADTLIREVTAYGSQPLSPVPQYWDGSTSYAKVQGINGATRVINYNSAGETFTTSSPGSVQVVSSAGGTAVLNSGNPGIVEVVLSAGGSAAFSNSVPGNVMVISSAGGTSYFSTGNPGTISISGRNGTYATATHTAVSVITSSTTVLTADSTRLYGLFINDSDTTMYLSFGTAVATLNNGIRLNANGGSYEISKEFGNLFTGNINSIVVSGSKTLLVTRGND